jgi:ribosomal protein L12E/L44/L45/RPP1/RPP2
MYKLTKIMKEKTANVNTSWLKKICSKINGAAIKDLVQKHSAKELQLHCSNEPKKENGYPFSH